MLTPSLPELQARNVHLRIEDESILKDFEAAELNTLSLRKTDGDRVIYESRGLRRPSRSGCPVPATLAKPALERRRTPTMFNRTSIEHRRSYLISRGPIVLIYGTLESR